MSAPVTQLLQRHREGDGDALDDLLALAYDELKGVARAAFAQSHDRTLQPTALLHEAWLKLGGRLGDAHDRRHFFALAARTMRQVLADHAKARGRVKRGGGQRALALEESRDAGYEADDLVALGETIERLAAFNERHARVVELRVFGALTIDETAAEIGVSTSTVELDWKMARAWLRRELSA